MYKYKFEKLVRDKIPSILEGRSIKVELSKLEGKEYIMQLKLKLIEEAQEVLESANNEELIEELADLSELVAELQIMTAITDEEIEAVRVAKNDSKGAFKQGFYINNIVVPEGHPARQYYLNNAKKYPEMR